MVSILLLFMIYFGCLSVRNDGFQKNIIIFDDMGNKVDIIIDDNEVYTLTMVTFLIGMIGYPPYITLREMKNYFLEGNIPFLLKPLILLRVPFISHMK